MKTVSGRAVWLLLASLAVCHGAAAIEAPGAPPLGAGPSNPVRPANSRAMLAGVVSAIDSKAGIIELDGKRRLSFVATTVLVSQQNNRGGTGGLALVKVGTRVSVVVGAGASATRVSEIWIAN